MAPADGHSMIDIHCHILPGVDDGSASWEMSAEMCRVAAADGIQHIVATPHANDTYSYDRGALNQALERLRLLCGGSPTFSLGCDFHFTYENVQAALSDPSPYVISDTPYLLVEFSDFGISPYIGDAILRLRAIGLVPVVTHPERNMLMQRNPENVLPFIEAGCAVQVTASALTGYWGEETRRAAQWLLDRDAVHVLASDAHDPKRRPPVLSGGREAVAKLRGREVAQALVQDNPRAIITGEPLPFYPTPSSKSARGF